MALVRTISVEEEIKRDPKFTKSDLSVLIDWLKKQPHLPPMSESELILFLHSNYYRTEPTKMTIDTFFSLRTRVPEFFTERDPLNSKGLQDIMKVVGLMSLPTATPKGDKVILAKLIDCDPSRYVFADAVKALFMIMELCIYYAGTCPGYIIILDLEGSVFGHLARVSPTLLKHFLYYLQDGIPIRLKSLHFINPVPFMDMILNLFKPFLRKELLSGLFVDATLAALNEKVPIDILPNEYGGKAGPFKDLLATQIKEVKEHSAWFQEQETRRVNEALRPDKTTAATNIFGVEGSFKKLDID